MNEPVTDAKELSLRENLVDLMSTMHSKLRLELETLFHATSIFSMYLDRVSKSGSSVISFSGASSSTTGQTKPPQGRSR